MPHMYIKKYLSIYAACVKSVLPKLMYDCVKYFTFVHL